MYQHEAPGLFGLFNIYFLQSISCYTFKVIIIIVFCQLTFFFPGVLLFVYDHQLTRKLCYIGCRAFFMVYHRFRLPFHSSTFAFAFVSHILLKIVFISGLLSFEFNYVIRWVDVSTYNFNPFLPWDFLNLLSWKTNNLFLWKTCIGILQPKYAAGVSLLDPSSLMRQPATNRSGVFNWEGEAAGSLVICHAKLTRKFYLINTENSLQGLGIERISEGLLVSICWKVALVFAM